MVLMRVQLVIRRFDLCWIWQHAFFVEIHHETFSTVILSLLVIQEGQLSVSGKRMRIGTYILLSLPRKSTVK